MWLSYRCLPINTKIENLFLCKSVKLDYNFLMRLRDELNLKLETPYISKNTSLGQKKIKGTSAYKTYQPRLKTAGVNSVVGIPKSLCCFRFQ